MQRFSVNMCGCNCRPENRLGHSSPLCIEAEAAVAAAAAVASSLTCICLFCSVFLHAECQHVRIALHRHTSSIHMYIVHATQVDARTRYNLFMHLGQKISILKLNSAYNTTKEDNRTLLCASVRHAVFRPVQLCTVHKPSDIVWMPNVDGDQWLRTRIGEIGAHKHHTRKMEKTLLSYFPVLDFGDATTSSGWKIGKRKEMQRRIANWMRKKTPCSWS